MEGADIAREVLRVLGERREGLTVRELTDLLGVRATDVVLALRWLVWQGRVIEVRDGSNNVYRIKG